MSKPKIKISVILPTYNEEGNIIPLIDKVKKYLKSKIYEIIVIDDNSPDNTAKLVAEKFSKDKRVRLFIRKDNRGLATAIRYGIEKSKGNLVIGMDTDFNHNPELLPILVYQCRKFDLVVGSRYIKGGGMENRIRYYLSYLYNMLIRIILSLTTHDNLSGFFCLRKGVLGKLPFGKIFIGYGDYFIRLLYFAKKNKVSIGEIPVYYKNRVWGQSKSRFFSMFMDYSKTVIELLSEK